MNHRLLFALWLILSIPTANAGLLEVKKVTDNIYALIGEIGPRTYENQALNNNLGFVITGEGVALVDTGATPSAAAMVEQAVKSVTNKPIRWVFNTGSQDHRWLGNSYFADKGAKIIALKRTVEVQRSFAESHQQRMTSILKERAEGIQPVHANPAIDADQETLKLGGITFQLIWPGDAHFPGDAILWLPEQKTVFTGDLVYVDRMLGVQSNSPVLQWQKAFNNMTALKPKFIVPGHGELCTLEKAQSETGDYLNYLVSGVNKALDDWMELDEAVEALGSAPAFGHLEHYDSWHRTNINRTYLQLEAAR